MWRIRLLKFKYFFSFHHAMGTRMKTVYSFIFSLIGLQNVIGVDNVTTVTSTFGHVLTRQVSVVLVKDTFAGAEDFCQSEGHGNLFFGRTVHGHDMLELRHWMFTNLSWSEPNETFWIGYSKENVDWYVASNCGIYSHGKEFISNQTDGELQCVLMNMTRDEMSMENLLYATSCEKTSYFACSKNTEPVSYIEYNGAVLANIPNDTGVITEQDYNNHSCFENYFVNWYYVWAVQEWHNTNTCTIYRKKNLSFSLQVEIKQSTTNATLRIKTASNNYQILRPSAVTRPIHFRATCFDDVSTSTDFVSSLSSMVCQSPETMSCGECAATPTPEELNSKLKTLKSETTVSKTSLSSYTRTKTSASDNRPSSTAVGVLGAIFIIVLFVLIISSDIPHFVETFRRFNCGKKRK